MAGRRLGLRKRLALDIFSDLYRATVAEHRLDTLFWECTLRCNLSCRHCGSDCRVDPGVPDMPLEDFLRVLDEEVTPHVDPASVLVIFSGGEVLVREALEFPGPLQPVNYGRALDALRLIVREPGLAYDVVTCVTGASVPLLPEFRDMLIAEGVRSWRLFSIFPVGRAKEDPTLRMTDAQFRQMLEFIRTTREEGRIDASYACEGFLGGYEAEVRDQFYQCAAGVSVASIRVDGSISGCTSVRADFHQGNIYRDRFWEVWQNRFEPFRNREWARRGECADCRMFRYCLGGGMHLHDDNGDLLYCHYKRL